MSLHQQIITSLRKIHEDQRDPVAVIIDQHTDQELCWILFGNFRGVAGNERGMALSPGGLAVMQCYFKVYEVRFDPLPLYSAKHVLFLDRISRLPWSIDSDGHLWHMDAEFAMRAKLVGDLDALMTAFEPTNK